MNHYSSAKTLQNGPSSQDFHVDLRAARVHRRYAALAVPVFVLFLTASVTTAYWNVDGSFPNPRAFALAFAIFWGVWLILSIYNLLYCMRFRVCVIEREITRIGVFGSRTLPLSGVSARWRCFPRWGSVYLHGYDSCIKIDFGMLEFEDRERLAERLHRDIPQETQENWQIFHEQVVRTDWPKRQTVYHGI